MEINKRVKDKKMKGLNKIASKLSVWILLLSFLTLTGCMDVMNTKEADPEVETYSYLTGDLTRTYLSSYPDTVRAVRSTLEKLMIPITETIADGLKTQFKARRADDTPVEIEIVLIDKAHTKVSVRTGTVGTWDRRVSGQIHGYIAEALRLKVAEDEKPAEDSAKTDAGPTNVEVVEPGITEENLAKVSEPAPAPTAPPAYQIFPDSPNVIFFGNDSNNLSDIAVEKLDRIFEILTDNPEATLMLNGYSDSYGADSYNQMISEIRANNVKSHLVRKGIDPARIMALGHGAQRFIASNKTREGRRMNRRVEIEIIGLKK
jgi:outer membrane protein OmpA-like peptidoglycan-associated protein